jgi:hypothetical protein
VVRVQPLLHEGRGQPRAGLQPGQLDPFSQPSPRRLRAGCGHAVHYQQPSTDLRQSHARSAAVHAGATDGNQQGTTELLRRNSRPQPTGPRGRWSGALRAPCSSWCNESTRTTNLASKRSRKHARVCGGGGEETAAAARERHGGERCWYCGEVVTITATPKKSRSRETDMQLNVDTSDGDADVEGSLQDLRSAVSRFTTLRESAPCPEPAPSVGCGVPVSQTAAVGISSSCLCPAPAVLNVAGCAVYRGSVFACLTLPSSTIEGTWA